MLTRFSPILPANHPQRHKLIVVPAGTNIEDVEPNLPDALRGLSWQECREWTSTPELTLKAEASIKATGFFEVQINVHMEPEVLGQRPPK